MKNGIREEAIRFISLAARELDRTQSIQGRSWFWHYVLLAPLATVLLSALTLFIVLRVTAQSNGQEPHQDWPFFVFLGTFLVALAPTLALAFAPSWVYADRRVGFAYRFISSTRSLTLRIFLIVAGLSAAFVIAIVFAIIFGD